MCNGDNRYRLVFNDSAWDNSLKSYFYCYSSLSLIWVFSSYVIYNRFIMSSLYTAAFVKSFSNKFKRYSYVESNSFFFYI